MWFVNKSTLKCIHFVSNLWRQLADDFLNVP